MSETLPNTTITPITQRIMARVQGATLNLVNIELRATTAEFLARTLIWRERRTIAAVAEQSTYAIVPTQADAGTVVSCILAAWYGDKRIGIASITGVQPTTTGMGEPRVVDLTDPLTVACWPTPPTADLATLRDFTLDVAWTLDPVTLAPDSLTLPESVLGHLETLVHGTLFRLYAMPDRPWTSERHAAFHNTYYRRGMGQARRSTDMGRGREDSAAGPRWQFPRFA